MAVTPVLNDTIAVKLGTYCAGQAGINTLHYDVTGIVGAGVTLQDIADHFDNEVEGEYKDAMAANATWYGVQTQRVRPGTPSVSEVAAANVGTGNVANSHALPTQTSGVITWRTATAGRAGRGRSFISFPGVLDSDSITDKPTAGYVGHLDLIAAVLLGPITVIVGANETVLSLVIYNRLTGGRTLVTSSRQNQKWGTQRSRGNYGAANPYPPF